MSIDIRRLKELRNSKKLNQGEMAEILGVAAGTYRNWEQGVRHPDTNMLIKLADYFDVSTDYLLGRNLRSSSEISYIEAAKMKNENEKLSELPDDERQMIDDLIELRYQKWLKDKQD